MGKPTDPEREAEHAEGLRRVSARLAAACRPCPDRGGDLATACLCPCPVAVARSLLLAASETGHDPGLLGTEPRGALRLQTWAATDDAASCDASVVAAKLAELVELHEGCTMPGCLACEARSKLEVLLAEREAVLRS